MDEARAYTDRKLEKLEKELERMYARAQKEVTAEWQEYLEKHGAKADKLYNALKKAELGGDRDAIAKARQKYQQEMKRLTGANKRYKRELKKISEQLARVDKTAYELANNILPDIYAKNYNGLNLPVGYSYQLVDAHTIQNLVWGDLDFWKDVSWTKQRFNNAILQGIMQGESIPKIAKRLGSKVEGNRVAAIRNARTAVTNAENRGRLDSMKAVGEECGLIYEKQWIATNDSRTRETHLDISGEQVPLDAEFSNGLQHPADPSGEPAEVWNCRCTMDRVLVGIRRADGSIRQV